MPWDKQVPGCFGGFDFAPHPADENRAFEWLTDLRKRGIGWKAVQEQLTEYLKSEGASPQHIESQLKRAERYMQPWLID